jgi:hypothetical protein
VIGVGLTGPISVAIEGDGDLPLHEPQHRRADLDDLLHLDLLDAAHGACRQETG